MTQIRSKSIYNIQQDYLELAERILDAEGELTPDMEEALSINQEDLNLKAINYGFVIKDRLQRAGLIKAEIDRLTKMKKQEEDLVQRLKDTVHAAMNLYGITEIKGDLLTINFRKSTSLSVPDDLDLDIVRANNPDVVKETISLALDKVEITRILKSGINLVGFELVEHQNLQIK